MKTYVLLSMLLIGAQLSAQDKQNGYIPSTGFVPDSTTAIAIAKAVLIPVYGETQIHSEEPFTAELHDGVWTVGGTLNCKDASGHRTTENCVGGVAVVRINKKDRRVLSMTHYK